MAFILAVMFTSGGPDQAACKKINKSKLVINIVPYQKIIDYQLTDNHPILLTLSYEKFSGW